MKPGHMGILSALVASVCCVGPLVLVLLGLGSLGLGAFFGRYHWWFILAAIGLLAFAWRAYLKEKGRCQNAHCEMAQGKTARWTLTLATLIVVLFVGLNLYTYLSQSWASPSQKVQASGASASVVIPVEGMTCFTCELTVESSLKRLHGVQSADARVNEKAAYVSYDPTRVRLEDLVAAINKTGYQASAPKEKGKTR